MLQSKAGYIDARPLTASSAKPLATHGRTIHSGQTEKTQHHDGTERSLARWCGAVTLGRTYLLPPLSSGGANPRSRARDATILASQLIDVRIHRFQSVSAVTGGNRGHCSDVSVGRGDRHRVVRSVQRFSLRTFSLGDSAEGREQDRPRVESIRAAPTDRVDTAAERLSQARRREAYI